MTCRQLSDLHHTEWRIESSQLGGRNSTFSMATGFNFRILVVDDERSIRETASTLLGSKGYEVRTAEDGFAALIELRRALPDLVISDLKMAGMNGFELLSIIRRRFPQIPVIAISGEYNGLTPAGLLADAFFSKASYAPEELFSKIAELLKASPIRPNTAKPEFAPVWVPKNAEGYFVLTCPECLRSFSVPEDKVDEELRSVSCVFCNTTVRYFADKSSKGSKRRKAG